MLYFPNGAPRALLASFLLLSCSNALAQLENGGIVATVRDPEAHAVPGVTITASSASLVERSITGFTDSDGRYRFPALPPGVYELKAELTGFVTVIRREVRVFVAAESLSIFRWRWKVLWKRWRSQVRHH